MNTCVGEGDLDSTVTHCSLEIIGENEEILLLFCMFGQLLFGQRLLYGPSSKLC